MKSANMANGVSSTTASVDNRKALLITAQSARGILQEDTGLLNGAPLHKNSFTSNLLMPDEGGNTNRSAVGEANKIDKRFLPQSPHTFLRHWDANKENKNPRFNSFFVCLYKM